MQPPVELSDTAHIIVWVLGSGCGLAVIGGVIKWFWRTRDKQATVNQSPSVIQAPVNNNAFAPVNNIVMPPLARRPRLLDREVEAYDAIGPCMSDLAANAATLHALSLTAAQSNQGIRQYATIHTQTRKAVATWYDINGKHRHHADPAVIRLVGQLLVLVQPMFDVFDDATLLHNPEYLARYRGVAGRIPRALAKLQVTIDRRMEYLRSTE